MKKLYEEANIAAIASKIREKTGGAETYTTAEMPSGVESVYEAGKKAEYDAFWDSFQENGNKKAYAYVFAGSGWNKETFRPKYSVSLSGAAASISMFRYFNRISTSDADDLLDFTPFTAMFDFSG
ncbi:MAG: hypothetical protein J6W14_01500, partial [Clostridia bacterium]|nr:hypothetical protein [Clostridia bacterium]